MKQILLAGLVAGILLFGVSTISQDKDVTGFGILDVFEKAKVQQAPTTLNGYQQKNKKMLLKKGSKEKVLQKKKDSPREDTVQNYIVYVFYLDPITFEPEIIYQYSSAFGAQQEPIPEDLRENNKRTFQLNIGEKSFTTEFSLLEETIYESYDAEGNIQLEGIEYTSPDIIEVKVGVPKYLVKEGQQITTRILSPSHKILKQKDMVLDNVQTSLSSTKMTAFIPNKKGFTKTTGKLVLGMPEKYTGVEATFQSLCPGVQEVYPGHNSLTERRINLVFGGYGYDEPGGEPEFIQYLPDILDLNGESRHSLGGLFSEEPFASNKDLFNLWYKPTQVQTTPRGEGRCPTPAPLCSFAAPMVYEAVFANGEHCISYGTPSRLAVTWFRAPTDEISDYVLRVVRINLHELGHSIARLRDEYTVDPDHSNYHSAFGINCVGSRKEAESRGWNSELVSEGCSYTEDNFRPTENSIMRRTSAGGENFGYLNEAWLCHKLATLTGRADLTCLEDANEYFGTCISNANCPAGEVCSNNLCIPDIDLAPYVPLTSATIMTSGSVDVDVSGNVIDTEGLNIELNCALQNKGSVISASQPEEILYSICYPLFQGSRLTAWAAMAGDTPELSPGEIHQFSNNLLPYSTSVSPVALVFLQEIYETGSATVEIKYNIDFHNNLAESNEINNEESIFVTVDGSAITFEQQ